MKKMIWLIFLFFPILEVNAETYYSDYQISDEILELSDTVKIDEVKLYKWYEVGQATKYSLAEGDDGYNCNTITTNWQSEKREANESRIEEESKFFEYKLSNGVRYIHLTDLNGSYGALRITELSVTIDGEEIPYTYECDGCQPGFKQHINNGIWDENESYITNGGSLIIDLRSEYPASKINLTMYLFDLGSENKTYTIAFSTNKWDLYINKSYSHTFNDIHWENALRLDYSVSSFNTGDWYTTITTNGSVDEDYVVSKKYVSSHYRYKELWCYYDYEANNYFDGYYENAPSEEAIKTEEYILDNRYYTRDKITIQDDIVLTSLDDNIEDYIESTTDYDLEYNFDKTVNGTYPITIKTPYMTINKDVKVLNKDTLIKDQEKEIETLKKENLTNQNSISQLQDNNKAYRDKIDELLKVNEKLNTDLKLVINHEQELTDYYDNKVIACANDKELLDKQINDLNNEIKALEEKLTSTNNKDGIDYLLKIKRQDIVDNWYLIILIILLLILLALAIKSKTKDD